MQDYVYTHHFKMYPVEEDGKLSGCVTTKDITEACSDKNSVPPDTDASRALTLMRKQGNSRILVTEGEKLVGIVTLKDLIEFLSLKLDLEEGRISSDINRGA